MGIEEGFRSVVEWALGALVASGELPAEVGTGAFSVERPKRAEHGDLTTNAPLSLQKLTKKPPRETAELLRQKLVASGKVASVEIAGPGFLNVRLAPGAFHDVLAETTHAGAHYGRAAAGSGQRILLEFVSANPTGPLLISHARGALVGDAVGRILEAAGHRVTREYYVNDFGNQVRLLASSVIASAQGNPPPDGGYGGYYVPILATYLREHHPGVLQECIAHPEDEASFAELSRLCVTRMLDGVPGEASVGGIKATLRSLGVSFDSWYSEDSLHRWGRVQSAIATLMRHHYIVRLEDGALVFKMPEGEGEKDEEHEHGAGGRVVRKNDHRTYTYFASDIAYHEDKLARGFDRLINVLGADHHGYVARIRNVLLALGLPREKFEVLLYQLVSLVRDGKPYKIGKRLGNFITVDEVIEEIDDALGQGAGADALRYFYLSRRTDNPVEVDVDLAKKTEIKDNPALYIQYGHARLCSILRNAAAQGIAVPKHDPALLATRLVHPLELSMLQRIGTFPRLVQQAASELAPTLIIHFLKELAEDFNAYWTQTWKAKDPVLPPKQLRGEEGWQARWDFDKTRARLFFIDEMRKVYATGLTLVGIRAPERMARHEAEAEDEGATPGEA